MRLTTRRQSTYWTDNNKCIVYSTARSLGQKPEQVYVRDLENIGLVNMQLIDNQ